jgi:hypothetical protein
VEGADVAARKGLVEEKSSPTCISIFSSEAMRGCISSRVYAEETKGNIKRRERKTTKIIFFDVIVYLIVSTISKITTEGMVFHMQDILQ